MPDFLSSLVHELRTPLTALRGAMGLVMTESPCHDPAVKDVCDIAVRNVEKLADLLDDVAEYARLRLPENDAVMATVDLGRVLEQAAERAQPLAEKRGVTVEVRLPPFCAVADETLVREGVARLVCYAVRVTPRDGQVSVSAETVGERVVIRVADQGKPVSNEDEVGLFEPFCPAARRGVDAMDRVWLDLAIAKLVAERHDGSLEYRQIHGGGVVRLTLGARCRTCA
jgi:signal transduction histidine kinase